MSLRLERANFSFLTTKKKVNKCKKSTARTPR